MIDIHSHILWDLDDGAKDRDESLAMLKIAAETGTTDIVATPHADHQYKYNPTLVAERILDLTQATAGSPRIHRGCDFHLSLENVQAALGDPTPFTINGLSYLLVEFGETIIPTSTTEIFRNLIHLGVTPIITHPERNPILQDALPLLQSWIAMGCLLQVTAQCLTDRVGKAAQKSAWTMLRKGMVHVIASDAHDTEHRPPRLDLAREILTRELGAHLATMLLEENPAAIIAGQKIWIEAPAPAASPRKWFQFWT